MKLSRWLPGVLLMGFACIALLQSQGNRSREIAMPEAVAFRLLLGVTDTQPTRWDGRVTVSGGSVTAIQGWRFGPDDSTDYRSTWKLSTRAGLVRVNQLKKGANIPIADNGVIITAAIESPSARFEVETPHGNFSFTAGELPYGESKTVLNERVRVDRVPPTVQLTVSAEEQDHPALAQDGDTVYLAFVDFTHGDRKQAVAQFQKEPDNFDFLARPAGGDQVKMMTYSKSKRVWNAAEPVSPANEDCMRAAVAVDGSRRVWVVWSAMRDGNFDLFGRYKSGGAWSSEIRITRDPGQDLNPVLVSDSAGHLWLAWQAVRKENLEILAAVQQGERFSAENTVSFSAASDWDPSIAAGQNGEIAVAWDTYDKGDYDVYVRRMRLQGAKVLMEAPAAIAASSRFEARPSAAYDRQGRLWIAFEGSDTQWGKDFGAYETTGIGLYQNHNIFIRSLEGSTLSTTQDNLAESLPGGRTDQRRRRAMAQAAAGMTQPNPALARNRGPGATPQPPPLPKNSFPRLAAGPDGHLFLAYRTGTPQRSPIAPIWAEQMVYFDGERWHGAVDLPHTDGLADVRPALLPLSGRSLLVVSTTDHRQAALPGSGRRGEGSINSDLYAAEVVIAEPLKPVKLAAAAAERDAAVADDVRAEREQVRRMRNHRVRLGGRSYQLLRGEFHRHTELSGDGGMSDGPIIDAYRYMLDAAYMDWGGCCDHDNGGREYYWWISQKLTDAYNIPGRYTAMFSYERSVRYPEGHRNTVFARRGVRPLPRLPKVDDDAPMGKAPDTQMLYRYLRRFDGIVASHTSGTNMGTDWRDNDPVVEPVVEIYQGDRQNYEMPEAPRANSEGDSIGGWRPLGFVSLALEKGYRLGFQASSDHVSTHMSYCNLWVAEPTREGVMEAFKKRRVYGATDNILAEVRSGGHFMGEEFSVSSPPVISVKLWGTADFAKVSIIKDGRNAYSVEPKSRTADFSWRDTQAERGKTSYYYVRGEQADGELVWVSPMWITYR